MPGDIDALLVHLPILAAPDFDPGCERGGERLENGLLSMPYFDSSPALDALVKDLYRHHWILTDFDWPSWQSQAQRYTSDPALVATADLETLKKLFTTHVRKERFCDGHLAVVVRSGHILALLRRLEQLQ